MNFKKFSDIPKKTVSKGNKTISTSSAGRELEHCGRQPGDRVRGNEKIDPTSTVMNYDLAEKLRGGVDAIHYYRSKLTQAKDKYRFDHNGQEMRKDTVTLCSWVVTAPKDLPSNKEDAFFEETYKWLCEKYGQDKVIAANVHYDETTPHMHFTFMPFVEDKEYGGVKLRAKDLETAKTLRQTHIDLQDLLKEKLGCEVHLLNGATEGGNKTITQLKTETLQAENASLQAENASLQVKIDSVNEQISEQKKELTELQQKAAKALARLAGDSIRPAPQPPKQPDKERLPDFETYVEQRPALLMDEKHRPLKGRKRTAAIEEMHRHYDAYMYEFRQYDADFAQYKKDYSEWLAQIEQLGAVDDAMKYADTLRTENEQVRDTLAQKTRELEQEKTALKVEKQAFSEEKARYQQNFDKAVNSELQRYELVRKLTAPSQDFVQNMRKIGVTVDENGNAISDHKRNDTEELEFKQHNTLQR